MKTLLSITSAIAAVVVSAASQAAPLLAPAELNDVRSDAAVRIIDIRPADAYGANHIPGALNAPYGSWRGPADNPGQLPPLDKLTALVQGLGLDQGTHAVVVSSGANSTDFGASARVYWTLKYLGLTNLSILNGGVKAWNDAGLPQSNSAATVAASQYKPVLNEAIIATTEQVKAKVDNPQTLLVDARPANFFRGETKAPTASVPGTIQNAVNLENDKWFKPGTSIFVSTEEAKQIAARELDKPAEETISFCNTGHWAATDWFALSEIVGQENVKLYPASLAEWTQSPAGLPMDNVPGRGQQLLNRLKGLVG
ncbi:putative thiosulfate sulfurtransferase [Pusillimonas sp. T7-7]|uniref:sulfurtransferase n=1 Tax=Pusillimonas sp. (strain T7-7) TaxID=1007105 RepID=UPI0002085448|nr:rhodanese-like domain-containing protein [Pusillimonas sp. T7-7]AEC20786.1 putative thiosulfate sulfurtransferase [Pusillimonas sp. T7-7]